MTSRPEQPEPFIRGAAYPATEDVPYPRANPTDISRLPADVWHAASVPVGVRIELVGDAQAVDVAYRTRSGNLGYRGDGAGITFSVWRAGRKVCEEEAVLGDGLVRLDLGATAPERPAVIYLPEGMQPLVQSLTAVKGEISPAPSLPRWIAYGDWTTQGWIASGPAQGWAAIAARKSGLNLVNMGYAGAGRGEIVSAEHIAALTAEVVSVAYGESCWSRVPHSVGMVSEGFQGFLDIVRQGHPNMPIVVISPALRPDAEEVPNQLGATLADIRNAIESVTLDRIVAGDRALSLVQGAGIIDAGHLADGIHPGDEGHKRIAAAVAKSLNAAMTMATEGAVEATDADRAQPTRAASDRLESSTDRTAPDRTTDDRTTADGTTDDGTAGDRTAPDGIGAPDRTAPDATTDDRTATDRYKMRTVQAPSPVVEDDADSSGDSLSADRRASSANSTGSDSSDGFDSSPESDSSDDSPADSPDDDRAAATVY